MDYLKIQLNQLDNLKNILGRKIIIAGQIVILETLKTKIGDPFCIIELKDSTGLFKLFFFGSEYESLYKVLIEGANIEIKCSVDEVPFMPDEIKLNYIAISNGNNTVRFQKIKYY